MLAKQEVSRLKKICQSDDFSLARLFNNLGDPTRLRIFYLFTEAPVLCPSDIAKILDISLPAVSYHLQKLEANQILTKQKKGQIVCYSLNRQNLLIKKISGIVRKDDKKGGR